MTVYEALIEEGKRPHCKRPNPCCEEPCDEPSFWDLLPHCRLNWIALGLAAFAIGFGLIGLGYLNIGVIKQLPGVTLPVIIAIDPTLITQGIRLTLILLSFILVTAWFIFKACSDDWKTVVIGSLIGAGGFPLAAIGLLYFSVAIFPPGLPPPVQVDLTWLNISVALIVASILGFLLLAIFIYINRCHVCISAKKGVVVSLIFLSAGWAAWSLGRLLDTAVIAFRFAQTDPFFNFPVTAYWASIAVSIANIVLSLALGWYVLNCSTDNCFTVFLPLLASAAPLGNWALYRVGLNVFSFAEFSLPTTTPLPQFAIAIGFVSITALILSFIIANGCGDAFVTAAASAIPLLYAIGTYSFVATARNLMAASPPDFVTSMLRGIFSGIALTAVLVSFLNCQAKCPIPKIIYGLGAGVFGWAIIYLYSTYSSNYLVFNLPPSTNLTTLNLGLTLIIIVAIAAVLFVRFLGCDELVDAINFTNIALLTAGAGGFIGTIAFFQGLLNADDIQAAGAIYVIYVLIALILPRFFVKCSGVKRRQIIAIASLAFGIAAIDLGRAIAYARAIAFNPNNIDHLDFSPLTYIASAIGAVLAGQAIVWSYSQANVYTALIASAIGLVAVGIAPQVIFFVILFQNGNPNHDTGLVGVPWLIFTLFIIGLLLFLESKSLCIPQHCRFLLGLLIPVLGIAVFGKVAGASAALGVAFNNNISSFSLLPSFSYTSRLMLVSSVIPLVGFIVALRAFKCTSCIAYLPSCIAFSAAVYVSSQFESADPEELLAATRVYDFDFPFFNFIAAVYLYFNFSAVPTASEISDNAKFITQVGLVYILFLSPALITSLVFACLRPVSAAIIGTAIAATAVSFGAFGISTVFAGVLEGIAGVGGIISGSITANFITFAQFLQGIQSQFVLLAIGVATALFIFFDKCKYPC